MRELERKVVLSVLDRKWREHLYEMDYLQEGIQLRSYGQRDPLVEYQREGFTMFTTMMDAIKEESVQLLFNLEVQVAAPEPPVDVAAVDEQAADDEAPAYSPQSRARLWRRKSRARPTAPGTACRTWWRRACRKHDARRACSTPRPRSTATRATSRRRLRVARRRRPRAPRRT